ncbi:hypothetical protein V8G54_013319 [Vigna mungo]|uniref:beta-carotene 3-hydroxylase n=1 Tax=Vigna mungo TaxID=3915 RepID=A0AAQ3S470_VIGMU
MAVGLSAAITLKPFLRYNHTHFPKPIPATLPFSPLRISHHTTFLKTQKLSPFTLSVLTQDPKKSTHMEIEDQEQPSPSPPQVLSPKLAEKLARKESERFTYLVAAVMSSFGVTSMAVLAVYYRFAWQMEGLGITVFGMAYMFVHDGLVHKRFPVGPIANVPYFRRVASAHQVIIIIIRITLCTKNHSFLLS